MATAGAWGAGSARARAEGLGWASVPTSAADLDEELGLESEPVLGMGSGPSSVPASGSGTGFQWAPESAKGLAPASV